MSSLLALAGTFKRDVCAELAKAAHEAGMRIGWYFSPMDWRDPDFRTDRNAAFVARMQGEIRELLMNYGEIDLLWFDWDGRKAMYDQATTYPLVKKLQPKILLTNRLDLDKGNKTANARFIQVTLNGQVLHEDVEMRKQTPGGVTGREHPTGPLMFQGNHGAVAYRNIRITPR